MDFNDTPEQAAFRTAAADWLAANVPSKDEIKGMNRLEVSSSGRSVSTMRAGPVLAGTLLTVAAVRPPLNKLSGSRKRLSTTSQRASLLLVKA